MWQWFKEIHSLLLGEADASIRDQTKQLLKQQSKVLQTLNIWAIIHGNKVILTI